MDTAGQERFRSINLKYFRDADCCLLVYDISDRNSFEEIKNYYNPEIKDKCPKNVKVILLGNKADLEKERKIDSEEASRLAMENDYIYMETSCLENENVADAFETLIENTYRETLKNGKNKKETMILSNTNKKEKAICPC